MPAVRLVVTITAAAGKGSELATAMLPRLEEVRTEPGCEQYELFQSAERPDLLVLLERWSDEETLAAHSALNRTRPPLAPELRAAPGVLERYPITE
ncbi:MAG: antibiotic biosynthesis monooxygenase [Chloroflexi bacterium]|nr:antibiotic biosynthesis monooxygenase [Chloroflexota bacterium]